MPMKWIRENFRQHFWKQDLGKTVWAFNALLKKFINKFGSVSEHNANICS